MLKMENFETFLSLLFRCFCFFSFAAAATAAASQSNDLQSCQ